MKTIFVNKCGIRAGEDITIALDALLKANPTDTEFVFEKGTYFISPQFSYPYALSNTTTIPTRKIGIWLREMKNVRLDFGGSTLLYSGHMNAFTCDRCENLTIENVTIDWPEPLVAEAVVRDFTDHTVDLYIDSEKFPHRIDENGMQFCYGNDEWNYVWGARQFDPYSRTIIRDNGGRLKLFPNVTDLGDDVYRFETEGFETAVGNLVVLRHNLRYHAGFFTEKCKNFTLSNVTVHSTCGICCLAQFCENLTYDHVYFAPNREAGRMIAGGRDDGIHVTSCKGNVTIHECTFFGLMDDPVNIHGCSVIAEEMLDERTVRCRYGHDEARGFDEWAEAGDEISLIERRHMTKITVRTTAAFSPEDIDHFILTFTEPLTEEVRELLSSPTAVALDNLTHTPTVTITNNRFGNCQGRGILISVPKAVRIFGNCFQSSGSAILIPGDANEWFESGECHDVEIAENVFTDTCCSVAYQFCEAVISICPVIPEPDPAKPFHKNIHIHDNVFDTPNTPVLYAFATENLQFTRNQIFCSPRMDCADKNKALMMLKCCRTARLGENRMVGKFDLPEYQIQNCINITKE